MGHVCICLATFNGAKFLEKQLASLVDQTHQDWSLWISDDGSNDGTIDLITAFIEAHPQKTIHLIDGPKEGYARNFLSIVCHPKADGDYYAFADQDDIWLRDKLEASIACLKSDKAEGPKLYGSRTTIIDSEDHVTGRSPLFAKPPGFRNALVQSIAGGNTMLMNRHARNIVQKVGTDLHIVSHDWWFYLLISGCGGKVIYDPEPRVLYRNHADNLIGSNQGLRASYVRLIAVLNNRFSDWNDENTKEIQRIIKYLTPENQNVFRKFLLWRTKTGPRALYDQYRLGLYRQTFFGTISLAIAGFLGKA